MAHFFDGLELLEPGLVPVAAWRPETTLETEIDFTEATILGGVARLP
ncbi:SAM-dependent methyltransferase [Streptosporangium subroseum]